MFYQRSDDEKKFIFTEVMTIDIAISVGYIFLPWLYPGPINSHVFLRR